MKIAEKYIKKQIEEIIKNTTEKAEKAKTFQSYNEMIEFYTSNEFDAKIWTDDDVDIAISQSMVDIGNEFKIDYEKLPIKEMIDIAFLKIGDVEDWKQCYSETFYILKNDIPNLILGSEGEYQLKYEY